MGVRCSAGVSMCDAVQCMREYVRCSAGMSVCEGRNNRWLLWWKRVQGRLSSKDVPFGPDEGAARQRRLKSIQECAWSMHSVAVQA